MTRKFTLLLFAGSLCVFGQAPASTSPTMSGVLMNASCQAIASRQTGSSTRSSESTGATSGGNSASAQGTTGSATTTTGGSRASATQGTSQADMNTVTHAGRQSSTAGVHGQAGATSGPSAASAHGTTGAAVIGSTTESSGRLQTHTAAGTSGDRNRSADSTMPSTVRDKYKDCMATATTSAFAIYSNGNLYVLDSTGNDMVRQQMAGEAFRAAMTDAAGTPKWMTVTVQGTPNGESLAITSIRK